jgi:hypothetical protein
MGLFKKIFKPVRKVLDKVIPNEIKPFLPYAAAAVPFLAPTSGIFGTMAGRAALSGGANLLSQLAQEGTTEDDLNLLSTGIAALSGALTAGRPDQFVGPAEKGFMIEGSPSAADFFKTKAAGMDEGILKSATNLLGTGASKVQGMGEVLRTDPFSKAGLKAATLPLATGTGDAMYAESVRLNKQQIIDDALAGLEEGATDAMRGDAIRLAMLQYGFSEDEIAETIASAGYRAGGLISLRNGGRVGFMFGSPDDPKLTEYLMEKMKEKESNEKESDGGLGAIARRMQGRKEESKDLDLMTIKATLNQVHTNNDDGEGGGMAAVMEFMEKNPEYRVQVMENIIGDRGDKIRVAPIEETSINILDGMNTDGMSLKDGILVIDSGMFEKKAKGGRVGAEEGGLMNLGGKEMDLRGGGFVPIGKKERADDVPARLSKNEFVMTADAVRAAGGGSVNKGAKRMYELMNNLEARV